MAMTIMNNTSAMLTLGQLNKNISKVGKDLKKISSGMKLNSAGDDASSYAISERMRVRIRGLNQDEQNVKNGKSMLRVGAGGIDNIVEELRNLKELALNSANDHNTDLDRATLQKEFDQRTANINDIASTTNYNGKYLLDGTYSRYRKIAYQPTEPTGPATVIPYGNYTVGADGVYEIPPGYTGTITIASGLQDVKLRQQTSAQLSEVYIQGPSTGNANLWIENLNIRNVNQDEPVIQFYGTGNFLSNHGTNYIQKGNEIGTPSLITNYNSAAIHVGGGLTLAGNGQLNVNIRGQQTCNAIGTNEGETSTANIAVVGGTYNISIKSHSDIYNGTCIGASLAGTIGNIVIYGGTINAESNQGACIGSDRSGANTDNILIGNNANINASAGTGAGIGSGRESSAGNITISKQSFISASSQQGENIGKGFNGTVGDINYVDDLGLDDLEDYVKTKIVQGIPLVIQHGTKANEAINVYINDMHTDSLGIEEARVIPRENAVNAIGLIDDAINYALDEATYLGSYISRLDFTEANIVTANEAAQASESVIRDADMAKEMTAYTKSNVLAQASQSMLAQANQTSASVLSLLQ